MKIYCLEDFKVEFEKLQSKKSYQGLETQVISYFFGKTSEQLANGTRLNHSSEVPYIKKRLDGSGGFRAYYLLLLKDEKLVLMFVHPKTGSLGASNIDDNYKAYLYKKVLACIESDELYELVLNDAQSNIQFERKSKD